MEREFYTISVYVDKDENLIGIPCGESEKYGIADIDTVLLLKAPYSAVEVENLLKRLLVRATRKSIMMTAPFQLLKDTQRKRDLWKQQLI